MLAEKLQKPWGIAHTSAPLGLISIEEGSVSEAKAHHQKILGLSDKYFGNDCLPMAKLLGRLSELENRQDEAIDELLKTLSSGHRPSVVSRASIQLEVRVAIKQNAAVGCTQNRAGGQKPGR
jgi:hypothetical protein